MKIEDELKMQKPFADGWTKAHINLIYTSGQLQARFAELCRPFGITAQQYNTLRILRGRHPQEASISLLKERLLDRNSDVSRLVERLLQKELITRKRCPNDRRQAEIGITSNGLELLDKMESAVNEFHRAATPLSEEEALQLSDLLDRLRD